MRRGEIECLNYRRPTASLAEGESLLHPFKLECQDPQGEGIERNRGCYKAVNPSCHIELDNSDMPMLQIEFHTPTNFVCRKCVGASNISPELYISKSSAKTMHS